jgi:phosphoglycerol transferase MdoB-like AlkP superfamily enzyme
MTTSNHRPYNFPENRIDLPQGTRSAAVKYTDYAIGKFIRDSKIQGWFKDTIFVITADHQASSAGKTKLPLNKYHIPLIIYSPGNITPSVNNNLGSQIDISPYPFINAGL